MPTFAPQLSNMQHDEVLAHLHQVKAALQKERDEDFQQYKSYFSRNNINHRKESGVTWYPIVISNTGIGLGEYLYIDIERTSLKGQPHQLAGGKQAALFSNNHTAATPLVGTIKTLGPDKIRLSLNVDELPDWCDDGKLGVNLLFDENSYREMHIALDKVLEAEHSPLSKLRDVLLGAKAPTFKTEKEVVQLHPNNALAVSHLNPSQQAAVNKVLQANEVALIHGPPGTGKTTTLVQAIKATLLTETQVMVCSASNTAVDVLTEKLVKEGIPVLRLGNPVRVSPEVVNNTLDARTVVHPYYKDLKETRKAAEEYFRLAGKYKRHFGPREREQKQLLYAEAKKTIREARRIEDDITYDLLHGARVIACTPVGSTYRLLRNLRFTTLFFDEAAQALEPMCWIPITRCERVVFAGDHFQLPPTVKSLDPTVQSLKFTLFERAMQLPEVSVMLQTQYRMHTAIMHYSNQKFYGQKLEAHPSVAQRLLDSQADDSLLNTPIQFIDTAGCAYDEQLNPESLSTSNPEEAALLLRHLKALLNSYEANPSNSPLTIGIIAPYSEQVKLLTLAVADDPELRETKHRIAIKSIDGFQGQERDIIYISMVRSNTQGDIGFLADTRRMNVAMTRAKKKLVLIGDSATLGNNPFYRELLDWLEQSNSYQSAWQWMPS